MYKNYSLALGGGAARGLIHIGVLRYLREQGICIDEVAGTSMGAIIAAFYAIGKTDDEMLEFAKTITYYKLVDADLVLGFLSGEKITELLYSVFGDRDMKETNIPLSITATNLDTWTLKIFTEWKIVDAIRASISIPWIFSPKIIDTIHYVDGGMIMNLPVQALRWENIIAVSALKTHFNEIVKTKKFLGFEVKTNFFKNNFEILNRSLSLLMKTNEDISLLTVGKNITVIRPNFDGLDALDFNKVDEFSKLGYDAAKEARW